MPDQNEAVRAAVAAERTRRAAVVACADYKGREELAEHLVAETDLTAEAIVATLAKAALGNADPDVDPDRPNASQVAAYQARRAAEAGPVASGRPLPQPTGGKRQPPRSWSSFAKGGM